MALALLLLSAAAGALAGWRLSPPPAGSGLPIEQLPAPPAAAGVRVLQVLLGGDVLLGLEPGRILEAQGPTALMRGWMALRFRGDVDLGLANLECALTVRDQPLAGKRFAFRADPHRGGQALRFAGFDGVSLANNHTLDFGAEGLLDTLDALREAGVAWAGAGRDQAEAFAPAVWVRGGVRLALLAFGDLAPVGREYHGLWRAGPNQPGIAPTEPVEAVLAAIRSARAGADIVIVSFHWGLEYQPVTRQQRQLGRAAVEAGADLVFGHHPHVPQGVELHQGRPILYSLGNLVFHPFQAAARDMLAAVVRFERQGDLGWRPTLVELHPLYNDGGRTVTPADFRINQFLPRVIASSRALGVELQRVQDHLQLAIPTY